MSTMEADEIDGEDDDTPIKRKVSGKVLILYVVLPLVVLIGAGVGVYMSGLLGSGEHNEEEVAVAPVFYDLPDFLVNLSGEAPQHFLKMKVTLQITDADATKRLDAEMPRVLDAFQIFLRELHPEDIQGSAGMLRIKDELIRRVNLAVRPPVVKDILFREVIVQ